MQCLTTVFRPAGAECIAAWYYAITSTKTPTALVLTRQNLPQLEGSSKDALKVRILSLIQKEVPDAIVIAGSEVQLGINAQEELAKEGIDIRVVSMSSMDIFEEQSDEYKESVLPRVLEQELLLKQVQILVGVNMLVLMEQQLQ